MIQQLTIQFNQPVITPAGKGYLVALDEDGKPLVAVIQTPRKADLATKDPGCSGCRQMWFEPEEVRDWVPEDGRMK